MNYIEVNGSTKKKRELVEDVVYFCINRLMPRMRTLDINVNLTKIEDAEGFCCCVDPRSFEIEIQKSLEGDDLITCVAHEMVHAWQYAVGTLKQTTGCRDFWKGKEYTGTAYSKQPWERQAYRMQEVLLEEFKEWQESA